jgi:single-strand DNA-binding protein
VCEFTIGVNRKYTKSSDGNSVSDFINIVAWRQQAEFVSKYFKKGMAILVCGSIQQRSYKDKEGKKRYLIEVVTDEVSFVEKKKEGSSFDVPNFTDTIEVPNFQEIDGADDLPF